MVLVFMLDVPPEHEASSAASAVLEELRKQSAELPHGEQLTAPRCLHLTTSIGTATINAEPVCNGILPGNGTR